jgi:hypothetical protein
VFSPNIDLAPARKMGRLANDRLNYVLPRGTYGNLQTTFVNQDRFQASAGEP